jgi:two-component system response regulator YesN
MHNRSRINRRLFLRYMRAYMLVLMVSMMVSLVTYAAAYRKQREETIETYQALLSQNMSLLDQKLNETKNHVQQIMLTADIKSFFHTHRDDYRPPVDEIIQIQKKLPNSKLTNTFIKELILYDPDTDIFISSTCAAISSELFYRVYLNYADMDFNIWRNKLLKEKGYAIWPSQKLSRPEGTIEYLTCIYENKIGRKSVYTIVLISSHDIYSIYAALNNGKDVSMMLMDNLERVLLSTFSTDVKFIPDLSQVHMSVIVSGEKYVVVHSQSGSSGLQQVLFLTHAMLYRRLSMMLRIYIYSYLLLVIAGILVAFMISLRRYRILASMLEQQTNDDRSYKDVYDQISGSIENMHHSNMELESRLKRQEPLLQVMMFERLLRSGFRDASDMQQKMNDFGISLPLGGCMVIIARLDTSMQEDESIEIIRAEWLKLLMRGFASAERIIFLSRDQYAVLVSCKKDNKNTADRVRCIAENISEQIKAQYNCTALFGIGTVYQDWMFAYISFEEAEAALNMYGCADKVVCTFDRTDMPGNRLCFSVDMEQRLIKAIQQGDADDAEKVLDVLFNDARMNVYSADIIACSIVNVILRLLTSSRQVSMDEYHERVRQLYAVCQCRTPEEFRKELVSEVKAVAKIIRINESYVEHTKLIDRIMNYIREWFSHPDLSLTMVGGEFTMSEKKLSRFFKEQTGMTFTAYVENMRMKAAMDMLLNSQKKVIDIAQQVGYTNVNTFYKAFRRVYDLSPSEVAKSGGL